MGNNKKQKPANIPAGAPAAEAREKQEPVSAPVQKFINEYQGMHPDSIVTALERIGKMTHDDPKACEHLNITPEHRQLLNEFVLAGMQTMLVTEIVARKSAFALTMTETQFDVVKGIAAKMGAPIIANYLPTVVSTDENGEKTVRVEFNEHTVDVSEETRAQIAEEETIAKKEVNLDPTKFESEADLVAALTKIITSEKNVFLKFTRSSELLRSYMLIKAGEDEAEKKKIKEMNSGDLLAKVFEYVGKLPMILAGFGGFLYRETSHSMSPVLAFCKLRDASKNSTGEPSVSDEVLVGIQRSLLEYCVKDKVEAANASIETVKKDIALLSKDKKNAKGIEDLNAKIATIEANKQHYADVLECVHNPSGNFADTFLEDLADNNSENYKNARQAFAWISSSYYGTDEAKAANQEALRRNVQQHIGIITNMFRNPSDQLNYSIANLVEIGTTASTESSKN